MFSGRDAPGGRAKLLKDGWKYSRTKGWSRVADTPRCLMAGVAVSMGVSHILAIGGDTGAQRTRLFSVVRSSDSRLDAWSDWRAVRSTARSATDLL